MAYGQLGDILFEGLYTPDEEDRTDSVSLPQLSRINRRPLQQFTGVDLGTMKLTITLHNSFVDVEPAIARFGVYRNSATHLRYITGNGSVKGIYVIKKTTEKLKRADRNGNIVHAVLEVNLIELSSSYRSINYSRTIDLRQLKTDAVDNAIANTRNNPPVYTVPVRRPAPTTEASAALDVLDARSGTVSANDIYTTASLEPSTVESKMVTVSDELTRARNSILGAANKVQAVVATAQQAQSYVANMYQAASDIQSATDVIALTDFTSPIPALASISNQMNQVASSIAVMSSTSQPLAALIGSRQ